MNLPLDDLREVRIREKTERGAWLVIKVGRAFLEALPSVLYESNIQRRSQNAVSQMVGSNPLDLRRKSEGMEKDGSRHVGGVGREAVIEGGIDLLGQSGAVAFA